MTDGVHKVIGTADHYAAFVALCRARIEALQITYATVDSIAGFPERYTATLLSGGKACSVFSFFVLAAALALTPAFLHSADDLVQLERRADWIKLRRRGKFYRDNQKREGGRHLLARHQLGRDLYRINGRKGGQAWAQSRTPKERTAQARKAAKARWRRFF